MDGDCGCNCILYGGPGYIVLPGGCSSPDIPWRCPSAGTCRHIEGMRERRQQEVETKRSTLFHWRHTGRAPDVR